MSQSFIFTRVPWQLSIITHNCGVSCELADMLLVNFRCNFWGPLGGGGGGGGGRYEGNISGAGGEMEISLTKSRGIGTRYYPILSDTLYVK